MVMRKARVIIFKKARESLREYYEYLKQEVSEEIARHVKNGVIEKCKSLKHFSGYSIEAYLEDEVLNTVRYHIGTTISFLQWIMMKCGC
jgi:predicted small metal-binding protein